MGFLVYFILILRLLILLKKMGIQNTERSEKDNSETKEEIRTKREVSKDKTKL